MTFKLVESGFDAQFKVHTSARGRFAKAGATYCPERTKSACRTGYRGGRMGREQEKNPGHYSGVFQHNLKWFCRGHNSQRQKSIRAGIFGLSPVLGTWARRACILNKRIKFLRLGDRLAVCPRSNGQTFPTAGHHCPAACSSERRIRWHSGASVPGRYDAKRQ